MSTADVLSSLSDTEVKQFSQYEEEAIISLALDHPDFFTIAARFLKPDMFDKLETRIIIAELLNAYEKFDMLPTRAWLRSHLEQTITEDDSHTEIFRIVDRQSEPREVPFVKETLLKWAKNKAFGLLYSDNAIEAYHNGNYTFLEEIIQEANRIADIKSVGFWFFEQLELLFQDNIVEHRTTGFRELDRLLNNGGPSPKEVVCWLAATNVGKSIFLCNNAISSFKGPNADGKEGQNVLLITFELDTIKTAMRCLSAATDIPIVEIREHQDYIRRLTTQMKGTYNKRFLINEMPPDECSVSHIYALLDTLRRTENWKPDVVIVDYMDLMVSRNKAYNTDDYTRQKHVANELRGLAKNENVLVFTATQTNRSGADTEQIADLTKAAESFGKQFALDYVISINQSAGDREQIPPRVRLFVAKNRNGPKHVLIDCTINYNTMVVREMI